MNQLNAEGNRHGYWEMDYKGYPYWKGSYDNGVMVGYWMQYFENGQLSWTGTLIKTSNRDHRSIGLWLYYNDKGEVNCKEFWL